MTQLSDEMLIAYADGELDDDQVRAVEGVLDMDPETLARLRALQPSKQRLAQAFQSMLLAETREQAATRAATAPMRGPEPARAASRHRSYAMPAIGGALMLLSVGAIGGYFAGRMPAQHGRGDLFGSFWNEDELQRERRKTEELVGVLSAPSTTSATGGAAPQQQAGSPWYQQVAHRHQGDLDGWLARFDGQNRNPELALFQLAGSGVSPAAVPELNAEEMLFIGAETLKIDGQSYVRLAYRDLSHGAVPVGLYVGAAKDGSGALERGSESDLNYVRWGRGNRSYMLIAAIPHWRLIVTAAAVQKQLARR